MRTFEAPRRVLGDGRRAAPIKGSVPDLHRPATCADRVDFLELVRFGLRRVHAAGGDGDAAGRARHQARRLARSGAPATGRLRPRRRATGRAPHISQLIGCEHSLVTEFPQECVLILPQRETCSA
jgi:hypothetical protein